MSQAVSASPTVPVRRKVRKPATKREPSASARDPCRGPCRPCRCSYPGYPSCRASFRDRRPRRARRRGRPSRRSSHGCDRGRSGRRLRGCGHGRPGCGSDRRTCRSSSLCPARSWSRRPAAAVVVVWPWGTEAAVVWPPGAEVAGAVRPAEAAVGEVEAVRPAEAEEEDRRRRRRRRRRGGGGGDGAVGRGRGLVSTGPWGGVPPEAGAEPVGRPVTEASAGADVVTDDLGVDVRAERRTLA